MVNDYDINSVSWFLDDPSGKVERMVKGYDNKIFKEGDGFSL